LLAIYRFRQGKILYKKAVADGIRSNRKVLVIGNPLSSVKNRLWGPAYGCGDKCIDLIGCSVKSCRLGGAKIHEPIDALDALRNIDDDSVVVFESGTAYLVNGLPQEIKRVGGKHIYQVGGINISLAGWTSRITGSVFHKYIPGPGES